MCGQRLAPAEAALCTSCHLHLPFTAFEHRPVDNPLARLFWGQLPVERAAAWFFYEPQAGTGLLIHDLKYHGRPLLAQHLGCIMARQMAAAHFFDGIDALVPVPLTRRRQWQRGYNQSMEICRGISQVTGLPIYNKVLRRSRFNASQTTMSANQRRTNVEGAFELADAAAVSGRHVLLIDDVITTGATVIACGQALCEAKDLQLSVLSLGFTHS